MDSDQLENLLNQYEVMRRVPHYVLSADEIPYKIHKPSAFIVNVDVSTKPGSHWVAFYFPKDNYPEFFDSLGQKPEHYNIQFQNFLIYNGTKYIHNLNRIQEYGTNTCGLYCVYYIVRRTLGRSYNCLLKPFNFDNLMENEDFIESVF